MPEADDPTGRGGGVPPAGFELTRETIASGALLAFLRAAGLPDIWTDEQIEQSRRETLACRPPGDAWVFGYGSLIWNPAFHFVEQRVAHVLGYHRRFCLSVERGRGSPEMPGLMLGLDRGGSVNGIAFRLPPGAEDEEFAVIWRREMISGAYRPVWLTARTPAGPIDCLTFAINRRHERYAGRLSDDQVAARLAHAQGVLGSGESYLRNTADQLHAHATPCRSLDRLVALVARLRAESADGTG